MNTAATEWCLQSKMDCCSTHCVQHLPDCDGPLDLHSRPKHGFLQLKLKPADLHRLLYKLQWKHGSSSSDWEAAWLLKCVNYCSGAHFVLRCLGIWSLIFCCISYSCRVPVKSEMNCYFCRQCLCEKNVNYCLVVVCLHQTGSDPLRPVQTCTLLSPHMHRTWWRPSHLVPEHHSHQINGVHQLLAFSPQMSTVQLSLCDWSCCRPTMTPP